VARSNEPFWWILFSVGGVVAAFLVPVHIVIFGLAVPLGWVSLSHAKLLALLGQPLVKVYLFVLIALPVFHWAHRFRFLLEDLGLHGLRTPLAVLCYGSAIAGTVATLWVLIHV
jgi:fumarate reductase subunit D